MRRALTAGTVLVVVEAVVIVAVADRIGVVNTLGLLILGGLVGVFIVKAQGLGALRKLVLDVEARRLPGATLADGALGVLAGVLLAVPGFLTDVAGLTLLVPGVRRGVRRFFRHRWLERGFVIVRGDELPAGPSV